MKRSELNMPEIDTDEEGVVNRVNDFMLVRQRLSERIESLERWIRVAAPMLRDAACIAIRAGKLDEIAGVRAVLELCPVEFPEQPDEGDMMDLSEGAAERISPGDRCQCERWGLVTVHKESVSVPGYWIVCDQSGLARHVHWTELHKVAEGAQKAGGVA